MRVLSIGSLAVAVFVSCARRDTVLEHKGSLQSTGGQKAGTEQTRGPVEANEEKSFAGAPSDSPRQAIQFQPFDLTSSTGKSPISIRIVSGGRPVGEALLKVVAAEVELREVDSDRQVPIHTLVSDVVVADLWGRNGYPGSAVAKVDVVPDEPLSDGKWYEVRLRKVPPGLVMQENGTYRAHANAAVGARFSPGSHLHPNGVRICERGDDGVIAVVEFSEAVNTANAAEYVQLMPTTDDGARGCSLDARYANIPTARTLRFVCPKGLLTDVSGLRVAVDKRLTTVDGKEAELGGASDERILAFNELTKISESCAVGRPW